MTEIQVDRNDLRKLSGDFRGYASRLLRTDFNDADSNLRRFIKFIDENEIIGGFIEQKIELAGLFTKTPQKVAPAQKIVISSFAILLCPLKSLLDKKALKVHNALHA